jgi:hypothetical protein
LYSSSHVRVIKARTIRKRRQVARMGEMRRAYKNLVAKLKGRNT